MGNTCARFVNVLTERKQNWLDIKEKRHAATRYHRKRNVKSRCHRSRTWKHHHHHLSTNTVPNVIIQNWGSIRTITSHGPVQSRYNFRQMTSHTVGLELGHIFTDQTTAFKLHISYGFILRNRTSGRYRYYHSSCNCCGRYLDEPSLITNADTFENFLERIKEPDILKWALSQRPNSDWVVELVTNATIFVNRILQHPIGCVGIVLPPYVKFNKALTALEKDHHSRPYVDNLCLFRCIGLHLGHDTWGLRNCQ